MEINTLTHTIIGCAYKVHNTLGSGFLEKVYENALKIEIEKLHVEVQQQKELCVWYEGRAVGCSLVGPRVVWTDSGRL